MKPDISPLDHERLLTHQHENAGVFPGKMRSKRRKNHGCGEKKTKKH